MIGKDKPGFLRGRHYTDYVDEIKRLRRTDHDDKAISLLLELLDATEAESIAEDFGVAPWYYSQLAIIHRTRKESLEELAVLERFNQQRHAPGVATQKLLSRLNKLQPL